MELFYARTFFLQVIIRSHFELNIEDNKFSSTEPKFDIFMMNITGKNTLLNSKKVLIYFACSWVISAQADSALSYFKFNLWIFLARIENMANNN